MKLLSIFLCKRQIYLPKHSVAVHFEQTFCQIQQLNKVEEQDKEKKKSYFDINKALIDIKSQILYLHKVEISQVDEYVCPFRIIYLVNYFITNAKEILLCFL